MPEWSRVVNTTIANYMRGEENQTLRDRKLTALMQARGRIVYNSYGDSLNWKVRYKRAPLIGFADADTLTFPRRNRWKTASLEWRGYAMSDSVSEKERLMNKSVAQIVPLFSNLARVLAEDITDSFGDEWYIDGDGASNTKRMHGVETWHAAAATVRTVNVSDGTFRNANALDRVAIAENSYAGINTLLADSGGTWTGSWPTGTGDAEYDYWQPLLVNWSSSDWPPSGTAFSDTAVEALRFGILYSGKNKSRRGRLDYIELERDLYRQFLTLQEAKERIVIDRGSTSGSLQSLGFGDVTNFDGVEISTEFGIPTNVGYGYNIDEMELHSLQPQLFVPKGPEFDIAGQAWRLSIVNYGNLKANPRSQMKLFNYA